MDKLSEARNDVIRSALRNAVLSFSDGTHANFADEVDRAEEDLDFAIARYAVERGGLR